MSAHQQETLRSVVHAASWQDVPADAVCIIDGIRTPFVKSSGAFQHWQSHDLGRLAMAGMLAKQPTWRDALQYVVYGSVLSNPHTSNVARESMLGANLSVRIPASTVTMACISANVAATTAGDMIQQGRITAALVGGTETFSDPPIRVSAALRRALSKLPKARTWAERLALFRQLAPKDLLPDVPSPAEFSTGQSMGQGCERLARRFAVSRSDADHFAIRSHQQAAQAWEAGFYDGDVIPVYTPPHFTVTDEDDGIRADTTIESAAKLRPSFDPKFGLVTAANASFLTDGASAVILSSAQKAKQMQHEDTQHQHEQPAAAVMADWVYAAGDPLDELLLGPALAIPQLLDKAGLQLADVGVWEIHEAFAAQVLANLAALSSESFCQSRLGRSAFGEIDIDTVNRWGGSLSLGHPFGATGGRLLWTAARRLLVENQRFAVVAGCAAGGHGSAILLVNPAASGRNA